MRLKRRDDGLALLSQAGPSKAGRSHARASLARRSLQAARWRRASLAAAAWAVLGAGAAHAGAVTDGSVGAVQSLSGAMTVPQTLGTVRGGNLFHSFARFGIAVGESATFTTVDPGIRHVIARVTGGEASVLQGPLGLLAGGGARPDFWLLNPAGVLVGAGASFNVPAGLHLSTAPQLRFADGEVWSTGSAAPSTLSVAAPESFGFLATPAAALRWTDASAQLAAGASLSLAGGEVAVDRALLVVPGGAIQLQAQGAVRIGTGALLGATAPRQGDAGRIDVNAASLHVEGDGTAGGLLLAQTNFGGTGGGVTLQLTGALELGPGATINVVNVGAGSGLTVNAGSLRADGSLLLSEGLGSGPGPALRLDLRGALDMTGGAVVRALAEADGSAGDLFVRASDIRLDGASQIGTASLAFGTPGALTLQTPGTLSLRSGALVQSSNRGTFAAGAMQVQAGQLLVDGGGLPTSLQSLAFDSGAAAALTVQVDGAAQLLNGGGLSVISVGSGDSGALRVRADTLTLQGGTAAATILGGMLSPLAGRGGRVEVEARLIDLIGTARIATSTISEIGGAAGDLTVTGERITLDGRGTASGIDSLAFGTTGNAGQVRVLARDQLVIRDGAAVIAGSLGSGSPGAINVQAGTLLIDGRGANAFYTGIGGDALGIGAAAAVNVRAGRIEMREGSAISSATFSAQAAGSVRVQADTLLIDGGGNAQTATGINASSGGSGDAGSIAIVAREIALVNEGGITTSTLGSGRGGSIDITAERMRLERSGGAFSVSAGSGAAGRITLDIADTLTLAQGGFIVANTGGSGAAGRIDIRAGSLLAGGSDPATGQRSRIASRAIAGSGGQTGSIALDVAGTLELQPDALLTIANDANVANPAALTPTTLAVRAGSLRLEGADITAAASGNARAGAITIDTPGQVSAIGSRISTTAVDGDGGPITITAARGMLLKDSAITTSVEGTTNGNGGDITLAGDWLALASGFVQANTTAPRARGGNVAINVGLLVPDGSNVFVGGSRIAEVRLGAPGYNVIQAAAPDGLAGQLDLTRPDLNLSSSLVGLLVPVIDFGLIGRDICAAQTDSTFSVLGGGALPAAAAAPLRISPRASATARERTP
jgi:filamentous hemagglutinin family protein